MEERLYKFARLVEAGTFTRASQSLHMSQPALSSAIAKLERELHTTLLIRGPRELQLTEAGKLAYATAKELVVSTGNLTAQLTELAHQQPSIAIGMIDSVAHTLFLESTGIEALEQQAKVSIVVNNSGFLLQAVAHDEFDLAFIAEQPRHLSRLVSATHIAVEPLVVVCHTAQIRAMNKSITGGKLPQFISYNQTSTTRHLIGEALKQLDIEPVPIFYSTSPEVMLQLTLLQKGVAVLPYLLVKDHIKTGVLSLIGNSNPIVIERRVSSIQRQGKKFSTPLTRAINQVQELLEQYYLEASRLD